VSEPSILAFLLFLAAVVMQQAITDLRAKHYRLGSILLALGIGLLLLAAFWAKLQQTLSPAFISTLNAVATNFWVWLGLILLFVGYSMAINLAALKRKSQIDEEIPALWAAMKAYSLPRSLSNRQIDAIARSLSAYPPFEVSVQIEHGDNEAINYWSDLQRALERAEWKIQGFEWPRDLPEGLSIEGHETIISSQSPHGPRNPKPYPLLTQALNEAAVAFEQSFGTGESTKVNTLVIKVGKRRRDALQAHLNPEKYLGF
jgi:hypothetical protein